MADLAPVIEQFKTLREEILLREKQHTNMVIFKIVSLGAAVSFIFEKVIEKATPVIEKATTSPSSSPAYYVWLIPLIAVVFDVMIGGNLRTMYHTGLYIKKYIEPVFREASSINIRFWEETVAQASPKYFCYNTIDLIGVWIFTLVPMVLISYVRYISGLTKIDTIGICVCGILSLLSLIYLIYCVKMKRDF